MFFDLTGPKPIPYPYTVSIWAKSPDKDPMSPKEVLDLAKKNGAKQLDLRFTDLPGLWQHVSYPMSQLSEDSFTEGYGIDGSSIRGWAAINESDMLLMPDAATAMMDPFASVPTIVMIGDVIDPITRQAPATLPTLAPKPSSSFSITSASIRISTKDITTLTPRRGAGIPAGAKITWDTARATRKVTFRCRPWIITRICARRWLRR
jgi:Glutamine synthetase, beta-Grasp domain